VFAVEFSKMWIYRAVEILAARGRYNSLHMGRRNKTDDPAATQLKLVRGRCCVCDSDAGETIGSGSDFEYATCSEVFQVFQCGSCGLVYLNPRPDISELERIYPPHYHSFDFSRNEFGLIYGIRSLLETSRLLRYCRGLSDNARILDLGCGDGFHLQLLKKNGNPTWRLEGVDREIRAVRVAEAKGLVVHHGAIEELGLDENRYDAVLMIMTIEHVTNPEKVLETINRILVPGGRLVIVTDNTDSTDFSLFKRRYWGGYHFPRHMHLFNQNSLALLGSKTGFEIFESNTIMSPVNWTYSFHNWLIDIGAPGWMIRRFTLNSIVTLTVFTLVDSILQRLGRGALLNASLRKPAE
jgi:ubiquinone/menaquinone biosynthesis C-methylase UbiE